MKVWWLGEPIKTIDIIVIFVCTDWCTRALSSWKIHWLFLNYVLDRVNISFYICDRTPQNITDTRVQPLWLPYSTKHLHVPPFLRFSPNYTHINFIHNTACISSENIIWSHCSCILQCSLCRHHHTRCVSFFYDPVLQALSMYAHLACS